MNASIVYALSDPESPAEFRYVGVTKNPATRLLEHLKDTADTHKCRWLRKVAREGRIPDMTVRRSPADKAAWKAKMNAAHRGQRVEQARQLVTTLEAELAAALAAAAKGETL